MTRCSHGLPLEHACTKCTAAGLAAQPTNEHELRATLSEDVFYPDHEMRAESAVFRATKAAGHKAQIPCAISGQTDGVEYHHLACEWAFQTGVDWSTVKGVATGAVTRLPVIDLETDLPTNRTFDAKHSLLAMICTLARSRGFDWDAFDPAHPETFIDSLENMLVLHAKFHRHKDHGIHALSFPVWIFQAFPRVSGFVFSADELDARHQISASTYQPA